MRNAASGNAVGMCRSIAHPTTRREQASSTTARYNHPSPVGSSVRSTTHNSSGAARRTQSRSVCSEIPRSPAIAGIDLPLVRTSSTASARNDSAYGACVFGMAENLPRTNLPQCRGVHQTGASSKLLKRQGYGRAKPDLLCKRVLARG